MKKIVVDCDVGSLVTGRIYDVATAFYHPESGWINLETHGGLKVGFSSDSLTMEVVNLD